MESSGTIKLTQHIKNKIGKFNIIYSPSRKFIWYKVPKTAGTSMFRGVMLKEIDDIISYKANPKEFDKWWNDLTDEKIKEYYTFTFVRNTYDRLVSAFTHLVIENTLEDLYRVWPIINGKNTPLPEGLEFNTIYSLFTLFITRCVRYWDSTDQSKDSGSGHWIPQNHFFEFDGYQHVDFLGTYENLEDDWKQVAKKIGVSEKLPFVGASNTQKVSGITRAKHQNLHWSYYYVDEMIINKVYELYGREIDLLYSEYKEFLLKQARELGEESC
jgi:hypothetical protein